jgi:hypothetical protein
MCGRRWGSTDRRCDRCRPDPARLLAASFHVAAVNAFYTVWLAAVFGALLPLRPRNPLGAAPFLENSARGVGVDPVARVAGPDRPRSGTAARRASRHRRARLLGVLEHAPGRELDPPRRSGAAGRAALARIALHREHDGPAETGARVRRGRLSAGQPMLRRERFMASGSARRSPAWWRIYREP